MEDRKEQKRPSFGAAEMMQALMPVTVAMLRPIAKTMIKVGIMAYEMGKTTWDELSEEARAELARSRERSDAEAAGSPPVQDVEPEARSSSRKRRSADPETEI